MMVTTCAKPPIVARCRGFSLIELLIAIAVLGLLAAIALPSFQDSIRKSRRSDAFQALTIIQQAQERWRSNNRQYAPSLTAAPADNGLGLTSVSPGGYYDLTLSLEGTGEAGYTAVATGRGSGSQAADKQCRRLGVLLSGGNIRYAGCGDSASCTLTYANNHPCWAR